jgi:16S rRNA (cytosine1402-N4)-methyltransferase
MEIEPDGTYIDATFGGGGHAREILNRLSDKGHLYGFDQDTDALQNVPEDPRFTFVNSNFRFMTNFMDWHDVGKVNGIVADLGVSWHHFDDGERGFSFRFDSELDMRMNRNADKTASTVLNEYSEKLLSDMFYAYGELRQSRAIAAAIVKNRTIRKINTTADFLHILKPFISYDKEKKQIAQAFQALRIEVNDEINVLMNLLTQSENLLKPGGKLAVITYHSVEDRLVKNFLRSGNFEGRTDTDIFGNYHAIFNLINRKVITPSAKEVANNPRARSAKLRIAEKT